MHECSYSMKLNELCEADHVLPNGNRNYEVNNCPSGAGWTSDVFRYVEGKLVFKIRHDTINKQRSNTIQTTPI